MATWNWKEESFPASHDFVIIPLLLFFFPTVRFLMDISIFEVIQCLDPSFLTENYLIFLSSGDIERENPFLLVESGEAVCGLEAGI